MRIRTITVVLIALVATAILARMQATRIPDGTLTEQLAWLVDRARTAEHFSGIVFVTRGDSTVFVMSAGTADSTSRRDIDVNTPFPLASVSKPLTALVILQLVAEGRLTRATTLATQFSALAGFPVGQITIDQLLSHRSGIEEVISRTPQRRITPDDLRTAVVRETSYEYSNSGYVCLALVIESVTGVPYETAIARRLFDPAGMRHSGVLRQGGDLATLARGDGGIRSPLDIDANPIALDGAGSLYASAADLHLLHRAMLTDTILAPSSVRRALMPGMSSSDEPASGWMVDEQSGQPYRWHSGALPGYATYLALVPSRDELVAVLSNRSNANVRGLARQILRVTKRHPPS